MQVRMLTPGNKGALPTSLENVGYTKLLSSVECNIRLRHSKRNISSHPDLSGS